MRYEKKEIDSRKIEELTREFLIALGDDPDREGLKKTPHRVAKMCTEIFEGMTHTNEEIAEMFNTCFEDVETGDLVVERAIFQFIHFASIILCSCTICL